MLKILFWSATPNLYNQPGNKVPPPIIAYNGATESRKVSIYRFLRVPNPF